MLNDYTREPHHLTRDEARALKKADESVTFFYEADGEKSYCIARKRFDPDDGFGARTIDVTIATTPRFNLYTSVPGETYTRRDVGELRWCSENIMSLTVNDEWKTFAHFLREGDEIMATWTANNNTQTLEEHRLTMDELKLTIRRPGKTESHAQCFAFNMATRICPHGSSARMIRFK